MICINQFRLSYGKWKDVFAKYFFCHSNSMNYSVSEYRYTKNLIDVSYDVIFGEKDDFLNWHAETVQFLKSELERVDISHPLGIKWGEEQVVGGFRVREYLLQFQNDNPLCDSLIGGALYFPKSVTPSSEIICFIHGHGMASVGNRTILFNESGPVREFVNEGYIVWAPDNVFHDELMKLYIDHDFPIMWAKVIFMSMKHVVDYISCFIVKGGMHLVGVAAGGHTALVLQAVTSSFLTFSSSGSFFPLDLLRRDYRISNHPNCFDFRNFVSYLPLFLLCILSPLNVQMGANDPLWIGRAIDPIADWFSGTKRGVFSEEIVGNILILRKISSMYYNDNSMFNFTLHQGGHTDFCVKDAINFMKRSV